jgi:hypothetical protein
MIRIRQGTPADAADLAGFAARTFEETCGAANRAEDMAAYLAENSRSGLRDAGTGRFRVGSDLQTDPIMVSAVRPL